MRLSMVVASDTPTADRVARRGSDARRPDTEHGQCHHRRLAPHQRTLSFSLPVRRVCVASVYISERLYDALITPHRLPAISLCSTRSCGSTLLLFTGTSLFLSLSSRTFLIFFRGDLHITLISPFGTRSILSDFHAYSTTFLRLCLSIVCVH